MIEIKCTKAQYERLICAAKTYYEKDVCFLGKTFYSCPSINQQSVTDCDECLRKHIKRVDKKGERK